MYKFAEYDEAGENMIRLYTGVVMKNGYTFDSRLLEDVYFLADMNDGVIDLDTVRVDPNDAAYFSNLNEEKWLQVARDAMELEDEYFETVGDHDVEVWLYEEES